MTGERTLQHEVASRDAQDRLSYHPGGPLVDGAVGLGACKVHPSIEFGRIPQTIFSPFDGKASPYEEAA